MRESGVESDKGGEHYVFRFEISMNYVFFVKILDSILQGYDGLSYD